MCTMQTRQKKINCQEDRYKYKNTDETGGIEKSEEGDAKVRGESLIAVFL